MSARSFPFLIGGVLLVVVLGGLIAGAGTLFSALDNPAQAATCTRTATTGATGTLTPLTMPTATADAGACYPGNPYGTQVVAWARQMANALYVNPACGVRRGGACNDTYYTSAFPQAVVQY